MKTTTYASIKQYKYESVNILCSANQFICIFCRKDFEANQLATRLEDESNLVAQLQRKIKELQVYS